MKDIKQKYLVVLILMFFVQNVFGQVYQFKEYGFEEGLSNLFVYTISEDADGFVWIGTGDGLCKFDGFDFRISEADDSLTNGFVSSSFLDKNGILWFGHNTGEITYYDGVNFKLLDTEDNIKSNITDFTQDEKGNVFISTQNNGVLKISKSFKINYFADSFEGKLINSLNQISDNIFLIGTSNGLGLYSLTEDEFVQTYLIKELDYISVQTINASNSENTFWIGTEDSGFYLLKLKGEKSDAYEIVNFGEKYELGYENIQSILEDNKNILWISTNGNGIFKFVPEEGKKNDYPEIVHYNTSNGLPNNFIKTIYQDWEGNNWIATYGSGLAFSADEAFTFHYKDILKGNILSIEESESTIWLGGESMIAQIDRATNSVTLLDAKNGIPKDNIVALYLDPNQRLWIATKESGIYQLNTETNRAKAYYESNNSLGNKINSIVGNDTAVWVGTENGVLIFNLKTGKEKLYNTKDGLAHNNIRQVFLDSDNNLWIATKSHGISVLNSDLNYSIEGPYNLQFRSITEDKNGNLWAATYGNGVFKFEKDSIINYSVEVGLKTKYCYSIIADDAGKIWVGHQPGMSSIDVETGEIKIYGAEAGISGNCNDNAILKQENGVIFTGTTDGLIAYDSSKEKKNILAPRLYITEVKLSDESPMKDLRAPIVLKYGVRKLNIKFIGLSYSNPEGVSYQYKLDGFDLEWTEFTKNREAIYPRIEDGKYNFILKACNAEGYCVEEPVEQIIVIRPPFWKTWWFIGLSIIIGLAAIYLYVKNRERKQKELQEYLEDELTKRTKEVVEQKEELEIKNRDITDSINYAQRIQQSILPSVNTINENFSGAFVCYQPRDIVSGDFYWYEKINDDKFLIVCADSTGHGVPGAFMSMIGTTLIKDICWRKEIDSPSLVLKQLDKELQRTLNQNIEAERAHDGMDIIVCEIDVKTHYMRFSSAMRPLIIYKDKELQYVKGTKASIGGDPKAEKQFENVGFQLHPGDIIYMFSDGYPDQFGGPRGKKFKMDRVKNMLADVCDKSMDVQLDHVTNTFNEWRGKLQQVDDVLFMGVKI